MLKRRLIHGLFLRIMWILLLCILYTNPFTPQHFFYPGCCLCYNQPMHQRVVFMGSPTFALPTLTALSRDYHVVGVVTQPDRAAGRGKVLKAPPVKILAQSLGIPIIQPETLSHPDAMDALRAWQPQLVVVAAFGQLLRPAALNLPTYGCLNIHASLLPRWRGAAPINAAILAGDVETGVTIMRMDAGLDTGDILASRAIPIAPDATAGDLFDQLSTLGADLLLQVLPAYLAGQLPATPQPEQGVTYAPLLKKSDGWLDPARPAFELERRVRAMQPWPSAWIEWQSAPLKILRACVSQTPSISPLGARLVHNSNPALQTADGILMLEEVQPSGKTPMSGKSFLAGARAWLAQPSR